MSFKKDVEREVGAGTWQAGLGGLVAADRKHVAVRDPAALLGSANVDESFKPADPGGARWDSVVGIRRGKRDETCWIEVHPASGGKSIHDINAKLDWLHTLWKQKAPGLAAYPREVVWVASGKSAFNARSPEIRALANRGCRFVGGHLPL